MPAKLPLPKQSLDSVGEIKQQRINLFSVNLKASLSGTIVERKITHFGDNCVIGKLLFDWSTVGLTLSKSVNRLPTNT